MKKLLTSAALALTLTAAGMTSYAVNWVYLGQDGNDRIYYCLLYTSPRPRD